MRVSEREKEKVRVRVTVRSSSRSGRRTQDWRRTRVVVGSRAAAAGNLAGISPGAPRWKVGGYLAKLGWRLAGWAGDQ